MGIGVIVHGFIESTGYGHQVESRRIYRHNRAVIRTLPELDTDWPFVTRSMFSLLPIRKKFEVSIPQYESLVIAFGASYKNMYVLEAAWIRKFERLLSMLCWDRAGAFLEFSGLHYRWDVPSDQQQSNYFADPPHPPRQWSLKVMKFDEMPLPLSENVVGTYVPYFRDYCTNEQSE